MIDYDKEKNFDKFSLDTLKDRYFWDGETHAQEAFARASVFGATFKGETDYEMAQRLYKDLLALRYCHLIDRGCLPTSYSQTFLWCYK